MPAKADAQEPMRQLMFGYTRVSTDEQVNGFGLEAQRDTIDQESTRRGWIVEHFADEGVSGKTIGSELQEVLQLLASGQGDGLVVAKLDRLSRSIVNASNIIEAAQVQGWSLVILDLGLDLTTAAGRISDISGTVGGVRIERTAKRKNRGWTYGTPKSEASSERIIPLAPWLADELREYLTDTHPFSAINSAGNKYIPHAPLFPGRRNRYVFDWASQSAPQACTSTICSPHVVP